MNRPPLELNKKTLVPTTFICVHPTYYIKLCFVKGICYFSGTVCSLKCGHNWLLKLASNRAGHHSGCLTPGLAVPRVLQKLGLNCVQECRRKSETPSPVQNEISCFFGGLLLANVADQSDDGRQVRQSVKSAAGTHCLLSERPDYFLPIAVSIYFLSPCKVSSVGASKSAFYQNALFDLQPQP